MQPVHGIVASQVSQYFQQGRWEELECLYRDALKEDEADARSAFRLGNLLAYQGRYREALACFETAWLHKWPGPIALNNKGVVLSCLSETRAAFKALWDASKLEEGCRPAAYNLGILCEKLGNEGSLPAVILDLGLGALGKRAGDIAREFFKKALDGKGPPGVWVWTETGALDRPLFLWVEDLRSGFGFEPIREIVNLEGATDFFNEGRSLIEQGQWQEGISKLEAAADLHPSFAERIKAPRTEAQVRIARSQLSEVRSKWDEKDFEGAHQIFDEMRELGETMSDRAFADEILTAGINEFARQISNHKTEGDWESLRKLIADARQRVESEAWEEEAAEGQVPAEEIEGLEKTPEPKRSEQDQPQNQETGASAQSSPPSTLGRTVRETPSAEHIRNVCRRVWWQQIQYVLKQGEYKTAIELLDFPDIEWFALEDLPEWRRSVVESKARILWAMARGSLKNEERRKEAIGYLKEGREAAILSEASGIVESFDALIAELLDSTPEGDRDQLRTSLLAHDDSEELLQCVAKLKLKPGDPRLLTQREGLVRQLLKKAEDALEAPQWDAAQKFASAVLKAIPDDSEARRLLQQAEKGLIGQSLALAKDALDRGDLEEAEKRCEEIVKLDPDHAGAREIRRGIGIFRRRTGNGPSPFDQAYLAYVDARDDGDPEKALDHALEMKKLDPRDAHTKEALDWVPSAFVHGLRVQLERDRSPETANALRDKLKRLFSLSPKYAPARELSKELRQVAKEYDNKKRESSYDKLGKAEDALLEARAEDALEFLRTVRDPDLLEEVEEKRKEALALLRGEIEDLLAKPSEENQKRADELLKLHQRWDPSYVEAKERERARKAEVKSEEKELNEQVKRLRALLRQNAAKPFDALKEIDRMVRALDLEGSRIRALRRSDIEELRKRAKRNMTRWQRLKTKMLYDRYYKELPASEGKEENR